MFKSIFSFADFNLFILLTSISVGVSIIAAFLVRRYIPLDIRYKDNAVIGNTASLISVIYGVLAGLSALYLINNNSYTADAVLREASAVADVYRDSKWLSQPTQGKVQQQLKEYLNVVIYQEWPKMEKGDSVIRTAGLVNISNITNELVHYTVSGAAGSILAHDMLAEVKALYDARQQRIYMSESNLSPELWIVILVGTALMLCINYLFGMNFYLHLITVCAAALMASSMIFLLITLDRPFQGEFNIGPDVFVRILHSMEKNTDTQLVST